MKQETLRILAVLCLWLAQGVNAGDVIEVWTDESGHTHYTNVPGSRPAARTLSPGPGPTSEESEADRRRAAQARDQLMRWESSKTRFIEVTEGAWVACERALHMIEFLRDYPELPVLRPLEGGEVSLMGNDQRAHALQLAHLEVTQRCRQANEVDMQDLWSGLFWPRTVRAAHVVPTAFVPKPAVQEPTVAIKGGRTTTAPVNPAAAVVNGRRPAAPSASTTSIVGARRPAASSGIGGISIR